MYIDLWDLECPTDGCATSDPTERKWALVDPLLKIPKKAGLRFTIGLHQKRIRLNLLQKMFPDVRTLLDAFEAKGADVHILFVYRILGYDEDDGHHDEDADRDNDKTKFFTPIGTWDLNEAIKHPESNWKEKLVAFLESVCTLFRYIHSKPLIP